MTNRNEKGIDMDKEKEVEEIADELIDGFMADGGVVKSSVRKGERLKGRIMAALKAERMKREEAETLLRSTKHDPAFWQEKIKKLEAKVKEQEAILQKKYPWRAKIVELENELKRKNIVAKHMEDSIENDRIYFKEIKEQIATLNKKAEKLVEALEFVLDKISDGKGRNNPDNYILNTTITKTLKEYREIK